MTAPAAPPGCNLSERRARRLEVIRDGLSKDITYEGGEPDLAIGYRFRDNGFKGGRVDEFRVFNRALTPLEVAQLAGRDRFRGRLERRACATDQSAARRLARLLPRERFSARAESWLTELHQLRQEQSSLINPIPEVDGDAGDAAAKPGVHP